jgi:hypothetical protein
VIRIRSAGRARTASIAAVGVLTATLVLTGCASDGQSPRGSASFSRNADATPSASARPSSGAAGTASAHASPGLRPSGSGYLASYGDLQQRALAAEDGTEPYAAAVEDLIQFADDAVDERPEPERRLRIGGTTGPFVDDTANAYGLALAYAVSGERRYATHAREIILAWVEETDELEHACRDSGACQTSLIVARNVPGFVFAADLLEAGGVWGDADRDRLSDWLRALILPVMPHLDNNWGDAGNFAEIVIADYLRDERAFARAIDRWELRLDLLGADGDIPEETRRGSSGLGYTQEALIYKTAVAVIAERRGIDLWSAVGEEGVGIREAVDYLARYWARPGEWPWHDDPDVPAVGPLWELTYARWCDSEHLAIAEGRRPYGHQGHSAIRWTTLTSALPGDTCAPTG